ncbi:MAG: hypothetical protein ACE5HW_06725 [Candidatus Methanofastidiosia archaeon]
MNYGDQNYYLIHGHQFEFADKLKTYHKFAGILCWCDDEIGSNMNSLWKFYCNIIKLGKIGKFFSWEKDLRKALKSPGKRLVDVDIEKIKNEAKKKIEDKFIIYGHTHKPFVNDKILQANIGSWVTELKSSKSKNTYIKVEEGEIPKLEEYLP